MAVRLELTFLWCKRWTSLLSLCESSCPIILLRLTGWHLNEKSRGVCIKARSPPASLAFIGQVTKQTTVKWRQYSVLFLFVIYGCCFIFQSEIPSNVGYYFLVGLVLLFYVTFLLLLVSLSFWKTATWNMWCDTVRRAKTPLRKRQGVLCC